MNDQSLISRILAGDVGAERQLYDANVDRIYRLACRMTGDPLHAEDLTQESFVRAFSRLAGFRGDAAFSTWMHQVLLDQAKSYPKAATLNAILELLRSSPTGEVQENAVFALSQHDSPRAREALRNLALDPKSSLHVREQSVFWIGQDQSPESLEFLKSIYAKAPDADLRKKIVFSISQHQSKESETWLLGRARDPKESMEVRKNAIFWLGQSGSLGAVELKQLYRASSDAEMKQQIIFVASQQSSEAAVDLLLEIARDDPDNEMRRLAIFWLGQSGDERALKYLESLVGE